MTNNEKRMSFSERNRKSGGYLLRKKIGEIIFRVFRAILLFGLCFLILQPLLHKISLAFMTEDDLYDSTVINIPRHFSYSAIQTAWKYLSGFKSFWTSTYIGILVGAVQVLACTLVGYGFARYKFPLKNFWFACVVLLIVVPPQTMITPMYLNFSHFDIFGIFQATLGHSLRLLGSFWTYLLVCMGCCGYKGGLYIYMMRQHFRNEPKELEEAAYVDGCGHLRTFWSILLPGAKPMIASCFLFSFVWWWTDNIYSRVFFARGAGWITISNCLASLVETMRGDFVKRYGQGYMVPTAYTQQILATATMLSIIPLMIIYVLAQKSFVESISQSGIKG